jgi:hypothetical protein
VVFLTFLRQFRDIVLNIKPNEVHKNLFEKWIYSYRSATSRKPACVPYLLWPQCERTKSKWNTLTGGIVVAQWPRLGYNQTSILSVPYYNFMLDCNNVHYLHLQDRPQIACLGPDEVFPTSSLSSSSSDFFELVHNLSTLSSAVWRIYS